MKIKVLGGCFVLAGLLGSASALAFEAKAPMSAVQKELAQRLAAGESVESIAVAAKAAGVDAGVLVAALVAQGADAAKVQTAMVAAGFPAKAVSAAVTAAAGSAAGPAAGSPGFAPSRFGITRAASVGGGGAGSVSPN